MTDSSLLTYEVSVCALNDLQERQSMELEVEQRKLFAIRLDNRIYAYWNICPHRGIPLNWIPDQFLDPDGELIQCSSHGALFEIATGQCIAGPCSGDSLQPAILRSENDRYFITANQKMPPAPINLRAQALADLEKE